MDPHEHLVLRLFTLIDGHDWEALPQLFTPSVCYERPGYAPICGIASLLAFYRGERVVADGRHLIRGCLGSGCEVSCWGEFSGVSRSGEPLHETFADWYWISGGRISRRKTFFYRPAI
ncbi:nuclear transport factor 2 family protein [Streptomyces sp. V4-01]|uniref:Nuclear transport factor 2 family protein n=1 Tax=Actinacidiphila polyblastidii TaxID=3110430 RepID=A0ABU7PJX5_9ACTN|nr:nuclear transport factor 2 family protein [Streptomyces sp. V4-01]